MRQLILTVAFISCFTSHAFSADKVVVIPLSSSSIETIEAAASAQSIINPQELAMLQWFPNLTHIQDDFVTLEGAGAVAFNGNNIWVGNRKSSAPVSSTINILNLDGSPVGSPINVHANCAGPVDLTFDGIETMWMACRDNARVALYNMNGTYTANLAVETQPVYIAFDGEHMWIANNGADTVSIYNAASPYNLATTLSVPNSPYGMATDGVNMWVVCRSDTIAHVFKIDGKQSIMTPFSGGSGSLDIAYDGANMWITNFLDSTITILRASDGEIIKTLGTADGVGSKPTYLAFDGSYMWVTDETGNNVNIFRASDFTHVKDIAVQNTPQRIAFDGNNMWITNSGTGSVSKR